MLFYDHRLFQFDKFRVFDFYPILTSRAHSMLNIKNKILNEQLKERYLAFLAYCVQKYTVSARDKLVWSYYLILMERQEEALKVFQTLTGLDHETCRKDHSLQYDYMTAYLDFIHGQESNFEKARAIVEKYLAYPVISWRNLFCEMANQLAEYDGEEPVQLVEQLEKGKPKTQATETAESLSVELEGKNLRVTYQNIGEEIEFLYYKVDFEVIFSKNPFFFKNMEDYSHVIPNLKTCEKVKMDSVPNTLSVPIPAALANTNVYIQVKGKAKSTFVHYMTSSLKIQLNENYGQIKVMDDKLKPLSKVYVKAYSQPKAGGPATFYK